MSLMLPQIQLEEFCRRWKIIDLSVFGSALGDDFRPDSDIDILASFQDDTSWSLFDLVTMQEELADILGRDVDLLTRRGVEQSRNPIRRNAILKSARSIYTAA